MSLDVPPAPTGATINLYLADGRPGGIRVVEKDNWNGIGIDCSRSDLARARKREEFSRSGVYLLIGNEAEVGGLPKLYMGEADDLAARIPAHGSGRDFWTRVVVFTSKDGSINKAHAKHLEARLCALAAKAKRCELDNKIPPSLPKLTESDRDSAERFLAEMLVVLPTVGITAFEVPDPALVPQSPVFQLRGKGALGKGQETSQGFRVFEGSKARTDEVPSIHTWLRELRGDLIRNGVLRQDDQGLTVTQDYVFDSPSAAAGVLMGRAANGRTEWKTSEGKTLRQVQEDALHVS